MTEYHVEYRIEVDAESAREAALKVAAILADGGAERGVYHVREHDAGGPGRERAEVEIDLGACSECGHEVEEHTRLDRRCDECADERTCSRCDDVVETLSTDDLCDGCIEELSAPTFKTADELQPGDTFQHGLMRADQWFTVRRRWRYTARSGILADVPMLGITTTKGETVRLNRKTTVYIKED